MHRIEVKPFRVVSVALAIGAILLLAPAWAGAADDPPSPKAAPSPEASPEPAAAASAGELDSRSAANIYNTNAKWAAIKAYWNDPAKWAEPALWPDAVTQRGEYLMVMDPLNSDPAKWAEASDLHAVPDVTKW